MFLLLLVWSHPMPTENETRKIGAVEKEKNTEKGGQHKDSPGGHPS